MSKKISLIIGGTGMDAANLAEFLLKKNYLVYATVRRSSTMGNRKNIEHLKDNKNFILKYADITDFGNMVELINDISPDEIYILAAQSHVQIGFTLPKYTFDVNAGGVLNVLEAVRQFSPITKVYTACSSEIFGKVQEIPQKEATPFYPRSVYGCSKLAAFWLTKNYREAYNLFCCSGILFNHTCNRRSDNFVEKKIIKTLCRIKKGKESTLYLGNLEAKRDIGWSKDYVIGMHAMLQQDTPDDYILATNETHSVKEIVEETCTNLNISIGWRGLGTDIEGYDLLNPSKVYVKIDPNYFRPSEVDLLIGDYSRAKKILKWKPKLKFKAIIKEMVSFEMKHN